MNRLRLFFMVSILLVLGACASPGSTPSNGVATDATGRDGQIFGTRDISDTYAYLPGSRPGGDMHMVGGQPGSGEFVANAQNVVYFDFDSATVRADSRPVVEAQARFLANNPNAAVMLQGHTDERGTREYNIGLGDRRANSVRQLLIGLGVAPRQIQTVSYGEERPAVLGRDEASYARNRRVEFAY